MNATIEADEYDVAVCVWPNSDWCLVNELEEMLRDHSDDYATLVVTIYPCDDLHEKVDQVVAKYNNGSGA